MSPQFHWQTETEEAEWTAVADERQSIDQQPSIRWTLLVVSVALLGIGGWFSWQVRQRVIVTTTAVTADLQASFNLLFAAAGQNDPELFKSVLSGSNAQWTAAQLSLVNDNLFNSRWSLGLMPLPNSEPEIRDIELAPDLNGAELLTAFSLLDENGLTLRFEQPLVFRRGVSRWLYSPPRSEFWGEWQTWHGRRLSLVYPGRDGALATRLAADLDDLLAELCTLADLDCPTDFHLLVRLDIDPATLASTARPAAMLAGQSTFDLPTLSLVGLPVDEMGYAALVRGYSRLVAGTAVARLTGYDCCDHGLFFQALLETQLAQLGLEKPLRSFQNLLFSPLPANMREMEQYWHEPPAVPEPNMAFVHTRLLTAYVFEKNHFTSAATMQRRLATQDNYLNWLQTFLPEARQRGMNREWLLFVQSHLPPLTTPLPESDILMVCTPRSGVFPDLVRYRLGEETAQIEMARRPFLFMSPLPDDAGALLEIQEGQPGNSQILLWRDGVMVPGLTQAPETGLFRVDDMKGNLLLYDYNLGQRVSSFYLLAADACGETGCPVTWLPGLPAMSPDGRQTLIVDKNGMIWLGDDQGRVLQLVGAGLSPFWLDATTFGFVRPSQGRMEMMTEIAIGDLETMALRVWLRLEEVLPQALPGVAAESVVVRAISPSPVERSRVYVALAIAEDAPGWSAGDVVLQIDRADDRVQAHILSQRFGRYNPLRFSPDGRWLTIRTFLRGEEIWQLHLFDSLGEGQHTLASRTAVAFPGDDWTADGQWLLRLEDGFIHLFHPDSNAHQMIVPDMSDCDFAAWTNVES